MEEKVFFSHKKKQHIFFRNFSSLTWSMFSNNTHFSLLLFFPLESHQKAGLAFAEKQ